MTTKNVYSRNNNVCLGVCMMVFMRIDTFKRLFLVLKSVMRVFLCSRVCFFNVIINVIVFFSKKRGYRGVLGTGKNVWGL